VYLVVIVKVNETSSNDDIRRNQSSEDGAARLARLVGPILCGVHSSIGFVEEAELAVVDVALRIAPTTCPPCT
jgi:hypothetical protein